MERIPGLQLPAWGGGIFIAAGLTLDIPSYLEGLWQACAKGGAQLFPTAVTSFDQLANYDQIILALGYASKTSLPQLPIQLVKGQLLELEWPLSLAPLPYSLVSLGYVVPSKDQKRCIVGATFERDFTDASPHLETAQKEIFSKVLPFFPSLQKARILSCRAGLRVSTGGAHLPLVDRLHKKLWVITGLGSKGLLYHAYLGQLLANAVLSNDASLLPTRLRLET
jgi:glycine/D-amino acid oxidase-like deaminating enzyme